jgi:hypothetical protein
VIETASATPLRVIVVSNAIQKPDSDPFAHMRFGHAASHVNNPNANVDVAQLMAHPGAAPAAQHRKGPCMKSLFRQKAIEAQNAFRKAFGLPLIEPNPGHHSGPAFIHGGVIQIVPPKGSNNGGATFVSVKGGDNVNGWWGTTKGGERVQLEKAPAIPEFRVGIPPRRPHPHHHHHAHMAHHGHGGPPFMVRLESALMALGPWEGRAVAFVIGAGIGVLLRMIWVFGILIARGCSAEDKEYEAVPEDDDEEDVTRTPLTAPPTYVYPIDEKVTFEEVPKVSPGN